MDDRISKKIRLKNYTQKDFVSYQPIVKEIDTSESSIYIDYIKLKEIFRYYHIISDGLKEVFEMYDNSILFQPIILTDLKEEMQKLYWRADIEKLECVTENSTMEDFFYEIGDIIKDKKIFIVRKDFQEHIIVNLYVAESILRRYMLGLTYSPIKSI